MLSKSLTFFLGILTILLAANFCFLGKATAQLIPLPTDPPSQPQLIKANSFVVYGRAANQQTAGIEDVEYEQIVSLPNLERFFDLGGTLELLTTDTSLAKYDIVMSEIMWGLDRDATPPEQAQWIELYNTTPNNITTPLFFLFTEFRNYEDRTTVVGEDGEYKVLDAVSNLHLGRWDLPGQSGRRAITVASTVTTDLVSAYRNIDYNVVEDYTKNRDRRLTGVPFGSYPESWKATPKQGRRNVLPAVDVPPAGDLDAGIAISYIATPGAKHAADAFIFAVPRTAVLSNRVVINEVRSDTSRLNLDWIELKNVSRLPVSLEKWELSIVTAGEVDINFDGNKDPEDTDFVDLPDYELLPGEILLIVNRHSRETHFAGGINITEPDWRKIKKGATHKYFLDPALAFPDVGKFLLLLRSDDDQNGKDVAIEDYAGNGFFSDPSDEFSTKVWPRKGQRMPIDVADFGANSFASFDKSWARVRYRADDGHHMDAWEAVGPQGGLGYDADIDLSIFPGTPGYDNDALKTRIDDKDIRTPPVKSEYNTGEISISEIMYHAGPRRNHVQWIELYNASMTQAVNLKGWELEIRNVNDGTSRAYAHFIFNKAVILPNQTLLIVSATAPNNVASNRVYDLYRYHQRELRLTGRRDVLLSPTGFYLKLTDRGDPDVDADDRVVDEAGNLKVEEGTLRKIWDLPPRHPEYRQSLLRQYGTRFKPDQNGWDGVPDLVEVGILSDAWRPSNVTTRSTGTTFYGYRDDVGTPGYRLGGPLPVQLSGFRPERRQVGTVNINWTTESELNNAGFNILRSESKGGAFKVINRALIPGAGTSGEKQTYGFTDTTAKSDVVYYYQIEDVSFAGVRRTLATVRLKGYVSASGKLTTTWGHLKRSYP